MSPTQPETSAERSSEEDHRKFLAGCEKLAVAQEPTTTLLLTTRLGAWDRKETTASETFIVIIG
jgi:hypothetical protein